MSKYIVSKSIRIKAEPAKVWEALTNPEKTRKYFFHCKVLSTWKVGDDITFKGRMFLIISIEMKGRIQEIEPNRLLKYTLVNTHSNTFSTVTDTLNYEDGETILTISDDVGDGDGAQKRYDKSQKGWDKVLAGLKALVEA